VPAEKVRLRIGDLAKAVLVTGQAYQDPKDALNEFVSNAADEYVEVGRTGGRIRILLRRRGRHPLIAIDDDGRGMDVERLRQIARNLFESDKAGDARTLGEKAIGILAFQQLGARCDIVTRLEGEEHTHALRLVRGEAVATLEPNERRRPRVAAGTTVYISDLDPEVLRVLTQRKVVDYLRRRRAAALLRGEYVLEVIEGKSAEVVTPDRPDGVRLDLPPRSPCGDAWSSTSTWRPSPTARAASPSSAGRVSPSWTTSASWRSSRVRRGTATKYRGRSSSRPWRRPPGVGPSCATARPRGDRRVPLPDCDAPARNVVDGRRLCDRSANRVLAVVMGWPEPPTPPPAETLAGADGRPHRVLYRLLLVPPGIEVLAEEEGVPLGEGYRVSVVVLHDADPARLVEVVRERVRQELGRRYLEESEGRPGWQISGHELAGRFTEDPSDCSGPPRLVVDGRSLSWEQVGELVSPHVSWEFHLSFGDVPVPPVSGDAGGSGSRIAAPENGEHPVTDQDDGGLGDLGGGSPRVEGGGRAGTCRAARCPAPIVPAVNRSCRTVSVIGQI
jgi:hypothetical protein